MGARRVGRECRCGGGVGEVAPEGRGRGGGGLEGVEWGLEGVDEEGAGGEGGEDVCVGGGVGE